MHKDLRFLKFAVGFICIFGFGYFIYKNLQDLKPAAPLSSAPNAPTPNDQPVAQVADKGTKVMANLITGQFTLRDQFGKKRTHLDFRGRLTIVYFGYIYCPDICPQALSNITEALYQLEDKAKDINAIFISVDPERDKAADLAQYLQNFHPNFVGLTGTPEEIKEAAHAFRVYYSKENDASSSDYLMDHSSIIYIMDKRGRFIASFNHESSPREIAATLLSFL